MPEGRIALHLHHPLNCGASGRGGQKSPAVKKPRLQFSGTPFPPLPTTPSQPVLHSGAGAWGMSESLVPSGLHLSLISSVPPAACSVLPISSHPSLVEWGCGDNPASGHRLTGGTGYICLSQVPEGASLSECPLPRSDDSSSPRPSPSNWKVNFFAPFSLPTCCSGLCFPAGLGSF